MTWTARLPVAASLFFGLGYPLLWTLALPEAALIAVKGAGVALLALAAVLGARTLDGGLLAGLLALGAVGDVLLEIEFGAGAAAFAAGHVVAIVLYLRNRRAAGPLDWTAAGLLAAVATVVPGLLLWGRPEVLPFAAYGLLLGAMAGSAWLSRFSRLVALGALFFLASDMLIALRLAWGEAWLGLPIWLLYYVGQLMIFLGVSANLPTASGARPAGRLPQAQEPRSR